MKNEIKIKVKNCPLIPINKLEIIQGNLKELSKAGYEKLKDRIARLGFDAPLSLLVKRLTGYVMAWRSIPSMSM